MTGAVEQAAIEVCGVTKRYGSSLACNQINLSIPQGTTFGLLGPNGAGKSTFIRMLMGLIPIDEGSISIFGNQHLQSPELRRRIGYVPELHYIYRWMSVGEVIQFASSLYQQWDHELASSLLEKFSLPMGQRISKLSKGMTAKLGLLLALSYHPELLILDEPTSGLDPVIREDFIESVLQSHTVNHRTVFFSSHHVDDVERVSDEVGILIGGRMIERGPPDVLRARYKRLRAVLQDGRLPRHVPTETVYQKLSRREWTLTVRDYSDKLISEIESANDLVSVEVIDLNLEEIFKDMVRGVSSQLAEATS